MKKHWTMTIVLIMSILTVFGLGCSMEAGGTRGSLIIQVQNATRNIFESTDSMAGDMEILGYKITLSQVGGSDLVYHRQAGTSAFVFEALTPGDWKLKIAGFNAWDSTNSTVSGEQIAYLQPANSDATVEGEISFSIRRGSITIISSTQAILIPVRSETGALDIVVDWSDLTSRESDLYDNPDVSVTVTQINDKFGNYPTIPWTPNSSPVTTETKTDETVSGTSSTFSFSALPVGWYEVVATMTSTSAENEGVTQLKRMGYVRVIDLYDSGTVTTTGTFTITDATSFATGSLDLSISENMDPLTVSFTEIGSVATINYPHENGHGYTAYGSFEVATEGATSANNLSYVWYVNGEEVTGQTASSMIYMFEEAGQYTITAVVYEQDGSSNAVNWGSASHEVVVGYTLGTEELLTATIAETVTATYQVTVTESTSGALTYVWYLDGVVDENNTTDTYSIDSDSFTLNVFVYELDGSGNLTQWGSGIKTEGGGFQ